MNGVMNKENFYTIQRIYDWAKGAKSGQNIILKAVLQYSLTVNFNFNST